MQKIKCLNLNGTRKINNTTHLAAYFDGFVQINVIFDVFSVDYPLNQNARLSCYAMKLIAHLQFENQIKFQYIISSYFVYVCVVSSAIVRRSHDCSGRSSSKWWRWIFMFLDFLIGFRCKFALTEYSLFKLKL